MLVFILPNLSWGALERTFCDAWRFQYQSWIFLFPNVLRGMLLRLFCSLHLELSSLQQVACLDSYNLSINKLISIKCSSLHHDQRLSKASFWLTMRSTCLIATPPHIDHRPHTSTHVLYIDFRWKKVVTISGALSYTGDVLRHLQKNKQTTWLSLETFLVLSFLSLPPVGKRGNRKTWDWFHTPSL